MKTAFTELVGVELPIVQAPMGGGPGTPDLVIAVSAAGGVGSIAGGYLTVDQLEAEITAVRASAAVYAVNLFVDNRPAVDLTRFSSALDIVNDLRAEVGLPPLDPALREMPADGAAKVDLLIQNAPPVVSFTFGTPPPAQVQRLRRAGCVVIGTATSVLEAKQLEEAGVDAICAQSLEAGAHSGGFDGSSEPAIGGLALVPQVVDATNVPVLAAGAIMDGRGLAAALCLGASAVQCGTAFLLTPEAGTAAAHRGALDTVTDTTTRLTRSVTGRYARGIVNRLLEALEDCDVPPYPVMHDLTVELRRAAGAQGRSDLMTLWAGQGAPLARTEPAADVVRRLASEAAAILQALNRAESS